MSFSFSILLAAEQTTDSRSLKQHITAEFAAPVIQAESQEELRQCLQKGCPDILIVDTSSTLSRPGTKLISELRSSYPSLLILPLIPAEQRNLIKNLLDLDVFFYLHTPIVPAETTLTITRAVEHLSFHRRNTTSPKPKERNSFHGMVGAGEKMQKLFDLIVRIAEDDDSTILIRGESGTGKEMVAKAIHQQSARKSNNFVPVNCAAIPDDLLESELFGYTKGAFTGAGANKIGRIQYAEGGTLFLDEIGDMKPSLQAKLLRVLQEKEFEPVGALKAIPVNTRILAATHCHLEQLVSEGRFREDLYYRLSVIPVEIPPLKERREDLPYLIDTFIENFTTRRNKTPFRFSPEAYVALLHFEWRGNVRELENLIQHMSILYAGRQVGFDDLPEKFADMREIVEEKLHSSTHAEELPIPPPADQLTQPQSLDDIPWHEGQVDFRELINSFETDLIIHALKLAKGNKKEAARLLNLKRTTLLEKIKKKELNNYRQQGQH